MLADFELAGGRSTGLTQHASPHFEKKDGALVTADGDGKLLDYPLLGGDFLSSKTWLMHCGPSMGRGTRPLRG